MRGRTALDASADSCLVLPVHPKELVAMVSRALAGNRPGHHTLGLDRPQPIYGRLARIHYNGHPAVELLEVVAPE